MFLHLDSKHFVVVVVEITPKNVTVLLIINLKSDTVTFSNRFLQIVRTAIDFYITVYFLIWKDVQYESVRTDQRLYDINFSTESEMDKTKCVLLSSLMRDHY